MSDSFFDLYRHSEWQRKRLEVMELAGFECANCGEKDKTLNVHHRYYLKGHKPWEYPTEHLDCLCEDCHKQEHVFRDELKILLGRISCTDLLLVIGFVKGLVIQNEAGPDAVERMSLSSHEEVTGAFLSYNRLADHLVTYLIENLGRTVGEIHDYLHRCSRQSKPGKGVAPCLLPRTM